MQQVRLHPNRILCNSLFLIRINNFYNDWKIIISKCLKSLSLLFSEAQY